MERSIMLRGLGLADSLETIRDFRLDLEYYLDFHREDSMAMLHLVDLLAISFVDFSTASHCSGFNLASIHKLRGAIFALLFAGAPSYGLKASSLEQSRSYPLKN